MAKIQYAAPVTSIRGSIGGWTFQSNRSGNIVRLRPKGKVQSSPKQSESIATQLELISAFNLLTPQQKTDWDDFSLAHDHEDRFGTTRTLTGQNWFLSINRNRLILSENILCDPPLFGLPVGNANFTMVVDDTKIEITKAVPTNPLNTGFKIFTTPPLGQRTTSLQSSLRLTKVIPVGPFTTVDITADWIAAHGCQWPPSLVANRFTVGVQLQLVRLDKGISTAGNTQLTELCDPLVGVGFFIIGSTNIVG